MLLNCSVVRGVGSSDAGKFADMIGFNGDPLRDVTVLERVRFVMKALKLSSSRSIIHGLICFGTVD